MGMFKKNIWLVPVLCFASFGNAQDDRGPVCEIHLKDVVFTGKGTPDRVQIPYSKDYLSFNGSVDLTVRGKLVGDKYITDWDGDLNLDTNPSIKAHFSSQSTREVHEVSMDLFGTMEISIAGIAPMIDLNVPGSHAFHNLNISVGKDYLNCLQNGGKFTPQGVQYMRTIGISNSAGIKTYLNMRYGWGNAYLSIAKLAEDPNNFARKFFKNLGTDTNNNYEGWKLESGGTLGSHTFIAPTDKAMDEFRKYFRPNVPENMFFNSVFRYSFIDRTRFGIPRILLNAAALKTSLPMGNFILENGALYISKDNKNLAKVIGYTTFLSGAIYYVDKVPFDGQGNPE